MVALDVKHAVLPHLRTNQDASEVGWGERREMGKAAKVGVGFQDDPPWGDFLSVLILTAAGTSGQL